MIKEYKEEMTDQEMAESLRQKGWGVESPATFCIDMEDEFIKIWELVSPYTMVSIERAYSLYSAINYLIDHNLLLGDFVECGVWKGGCCMLMAYTLLARGIKAPSLYLYDTFKGMSQPSDRDIIRKTGEKVQNRWKEGWWAVNEKEVLNNLLSTGYPKEKIKLIKGEVEKTLLKEKPLSISLLRLDTDWYASTLCEFEQLYPLLVSKGVFIIDDYGHFKGAKDAFDTYFASPEERPLLFRSDYTGRIGIKI